MVIKDQPILSRLLQTKSYKSNQFGCWLKNPGWKITIKEQSVSSYIKELDEIYRGFSFKGTDNKRHLRGQQEIST